MNILYVITALGIGGAENLLVDVCQKMMGQHNITVAYLREPADYHAKIESLGIPVTFVNRKKLGILGSFIKLHQIIKNKKIDLVHTHLPAADTLGRLAALSVGHVSVVSTIHNSDLWKLKNDPISLLLRAYNRFTVNCFRRACLIAVSHSAKDFCCEREGIKGDKISVIYNFIDFDNPVKSQPGFEFPLKNGPFTIITAARMEPNKGHLLLLKAVRLLVKEKRIKDLRVMLLGQGSCEQALRDFANREGISENIYFMGVHSNIYDYMKAADLMVLPSQNEGQSIAVLEAFYCGIPVLASDIPANVEQLNGGQNGFLFSLAGGEDALASAIQSFYEGEEKHDEIQNKAKEYCLSLSAEHHIETLLNLYLQLRCK